MRTLLPTPTIEIDASSAARSTHRKARARRILLGCTLGLVTLSATAADPRLPGRIAYRAIIMARGGHFIPYPGAVLQSGFSDCGPAALATLLHTLGIASPPTDSIARLAGTEASGTVFSDLQRAAAHLGVPGELRRLGVPERRRLSTPLIAWVDQGHYVTIVPDADGVVVVLDPQVGPYRIGLDRLGRYWAGEALIPAPTRTSAGAARSTPPHRGGTT